VRTFAAAVLAITIGAATAAAEPRHGISVFGDLKYPADFTHFDFVNPDAPQGGRIALIGPVPIETFDSFNGYILKGDPVQGFGLMCGFYLNELLLRLVPRDDPHEALFDAYATCLERLAHGESTPVVLRGFEKQLLAELGYAMMLDREAESGTPIDPGMQYLYDPERGPVAVNGARRDDMVVYGRTLLELDSGQFSGAETLAEARNLMRGLIGQRLQGQTLHTRNVLMELQDL
jgi:recombinational DNA repair protein (RecF pathway)